MICMYKNENTGFLKKKIENESENRAMKLVNEAESLHD
jgi:hypothetical protein